MPASKFFFELKILENESEIIACHQLLYHNKTSYIVITEQKKMRNSGRNHI